MGEGKGGDVGEGEGCVMRCAAFRAVPRGEWPRKQQPKRHTCDGWHAHARSDSVRASTPPALSHERISATHARAHTHGLGTQIWVAVEKREEERKLQQQARKASRDNSSSTNCNSSDKPTS